MKLLRYFLLNRLIKDPITTAQIYHMIYQNGVAPTRKEVVAVPTNLPIISEVKSSKVSDIRTALKELKSKPIKTKQDKDSIGMLEAALKNGYE